MLRVDRVTVGRDRVVLFSRQGRVEVEIFRLGWRFLA